MPKYEIEVPGKGKFQVESPTDLSDEQVYLAIQDELNKPEKKPPEASMRSEAVKSFKQLGSSYETALDTFLKDPEEAVKAGMKRREEFIKEYGEARGLEEFKKKYGEQGILAAGIELTTQVPTAVAGQTANLVSMMAGGKLASWLGGAIGSIFGPAGTVAGATIGGYAGAAATQVPAFYEENLIAQMREQQARGEPVDLNRAKAAVAAVGQAGVEVGGAVIAFGKRLVTGLIGSKPAREAQEELLKKATETLRKQADRSLAGATATGAGRAIATEMPVELAQNIITRYQAGQDLTSDDAYADYGNTLYETLKVAGPLGAVSGPINRSFARDELDTQAARKQQREKAAAQKPQEEPQQPAAEPFVPSEAPAAPVAPTVEPTAEDLRQQTYADQIARQDALERRAMGVVPAEEDMATQVARQDALQAQMQEGAPAGQLLSPAEVRLQRQQQAAEQFGLNEPLAAPPATPRMPTYEPIPGLTPETAQGFIDQDRFTQQTPLPQVTPSQVPERVPTQPVEPEVMRQRIDAQSQLLAQAQQEPFAFDRRRVERAADLAVGTGQVNVPPAAQIVELTPMTMTQARQRLAMIKNDAEQAGQDPNSFFVIRHPDRSDRFAIEQRRAPEPTGYVPPMIETTPLLPFAVQDMIESAAGEGQRRAARTPDLIAQQSQRVADQAALNAELRGGVATTEEAERLRLQGMGRPYDVVQEPQTEQVRPLTSKSERERLIEEQIRLEREARNADPEAIARLRHHQALHGPELWLEGFDVNFEAGRPVQKASPQFEQTFMAPGRYSLAEPVAATPEAKAALGKLKKDLTQALRRFGLDKVAIRLVDSIENGTADGMYAKQIITLALDSDNPMGVMRHEVIHALRELGAFTQAEWKVLSKAAKDKWIDQFFDKAMQDRYRQVYLDQNDGKLDGFDDYMQEEAVAQAFRFYSERKPPAGRPGNIFTRIAQFFKELRDALLGNNIQTVDDMFLPERIFADIERGAITPGRAGVRKEGLPRFNMRMEQSGDLTPMDVQNVRIYNTEIESLVKKIGDRIAGMTSDKTVADVKKAIKKLQSYTAQGLKGREWYERSANTILEAFDGDPVLAEKLFQIIAITSANTEVAANFTKATKAWTQFAEGKPIKVGTGNENKKIEALLYFGVDWDGRKTNTFYTNLMEAMEGKDSGRSTIDLHMTRMIFDKDAPTDAQYELAENMVRLLATKLKIPPRQVQAASWVTQKAKTIFDDYRAKGWKKGLNDEQLREFAFERAVTDYSHLMKAKVKALPVTPALQEPSPSIRARTQTITGEVIPSVKTEMSQMEEMSFPMKDKFTKDIMRSDAVQNIAKEVGITSRIRVTTESGAYEGKVNPNLKVQLINRDPAVAEQDARDLAYAMSYVFKQDATPFFRADPALLDQEQYGISLQFGKTLTPAVQKKILGVMNQYLGADAGFSKVGPNEIVLINYRGEDGQPFLMSDPDFIDALAKAREDINKFAPIEASKAFGAKSEYPYHDWQQDTSGAAIVQRLRDSRDQRPNLQARLDRLRESFISSARDAVKQSGAEPRFSLRYFPPESNQSALRPRDDGRAGIAFQDRRPDAATYSGSHYGKAKAPVLSGGFYGTGLRGAESRRLDQSRDPRIKKRVYFYIPRTNGTMPNREAGVGNHVYTQKFTNILGPGQSMSALYKQAGGDSNAFESLIVDAGYDGYAVPDYGMMVILNNDVPADYEGTVQEIYAKPEAPKFSLRAPTTPPFKRWFGKSKIVNPDGTPKVMYHGTSRIIEEFIPGQARAIFVTDNPSLAGSFAKDSLKSAMNEKIDQIKDEYYRMDTADKLKFLKKAYRLGVKQKAMSKLSADRSIAELEKRVEDGDTDLLNTFERVSDLLEEAAYNELESGRNIMPLYVRAENPFDYDNPDHIAKLVENAEGVDLSGSIRPIQNGSWRIIESEKIQDIIKNAGFDGFYVLEDGNKNLAVYNPNQIKSATGNDGTYGLDTGKINYSLKNAPPKRNTKLMADDASTSDAIIEVASNAIDAVRSDQGRTSARVALIDKYSGVAKVLSSEAQYSDGKLRADLLHHAKAQGINTIKNGLVSGVPVLNDDGTITIERSENNLARAKYLADKLDTNQNVIDSGLSGRSYIAEIARTLRGMEIMEEDAAARKLGAEQLAEADRQSAALKEAARLGTMSPRMIADQQKVIDQMRKDGNANIKVNRELQVDPEMIAWTKKQLEITPEAQEILDIFRNINLSLIKLREDTGLIDAEMADQLRANKYYVPLYKSQEDLEASTLFPRGPGTKSTPKMHKLKGAINERNIWENFAKHYAGTVAVAYENQVRRASVEQMRAIDPDLAQITNASDKRVNLRYRENGKDVHVIIEDPNILAAFQASTFQMGPFMRFFAGFTKVLRAGALINPMFWIRQLIRDPIHATLTAQTGAVTPFHSAAEYIRVLTKNSEEARILADRGVIGQFDSLLTLEDFLKTVGKEAPRGKNFVQRALDRALEFHEASDAATRVAIFKKAKAEALKKGMSESQAVDYAVFKARESINFAVMGNSTAIAYARQMIPFFNATIVGLDTLWRAWRGTNLNPEEKAKAKKMFASRAIMMVLFSSIYAVMMQDSEEYKKLPDYVKDGNWLLPIWLPSGITFIKVPVPYEVGFLFKTLPEVFVRYMAGTSTGKESIAAVRSGFIHNMPTGGVPIPQFIKPAFEVWTNHSFFTNRPIEGMGDSRLPVAMRGQKASEFAKMMSGLGLNNFGLSPAKIDTLTKGYFAEMGTFFNEFTDALIAVGSGKEKTSRNIQNMPFMRSFLTDPYVNKAISDFYEIEKSASEAANAFSKYRKEGRSSELEALLQDPEKRQQIAVIPTLRRISQRMSDISAAIRNIDERKTMDPDERRIQIDKLQLELAKTAEAGKQVAGIAGLVR